MTTNVLSSRQAAVCGAARASWRERLQAMAGSSDDSAIGIGLVVVDASRRGHAVPVVAGTANIPFAPVF